MEFILNRVQTGWLLWSLTPAVKGIDRWGCTPVKKIKCPPDLNRPLNHPGQSVNNGGQPHSVGGQRWALQLK